MNWKLALDIQMEQHKWHLSDDGMVFTFGFFLDFLEKKVQHEPEEFYVERKDDALKLTKNLMTTLWRADTMYVTTEMQHLLLQAAHDLPANAQFDVHNLLTPIGFCLFEETMYGEDVNGKKIAVNAFAWHVAPVQLYFNRDTGEVVQSPDGEGELHQVIAMYFFTPTDDMSDEMNNVIIPDMRAKGMVIPPLALAHFLPALNGRTVPDFHGQQGAELVVGLLKLFLAIQYIGHQPIGQPIKMRPDRAARKRFKREHPEEPERLISLITLRRKKVVKDDEEPKKVEWSRRWVVRGFWRKQWYPSQKRHDWKYIHEYIKGPEDKPLVITERRVFNFRR